MFADIRRFANKTSNHQPENTISNAVIRYQAKRKLEGVASFTNTASYVNRPYEPISNSEIEHLPSEIWPPNVELSFYQVHCSCQNLSCIVAVSEELIWRQSTRR